MGCGTSSSAPTRVVEVRKRRSSSRSDPYLRQLRKYRKWFKKADGNGDGSLSMAELRQLLDERAANQQNAAMGHWMRLFDADRDGVISWEEFVTIMDKQQALGIQFTKKRTRRQQVCREAKKYFGEQNCPITNRDSLVRATLCAQWLTSTTHLSYEQSTTIVELFFKEHGIQKEEGRSDLLIAFGDIFSDLYHAYKHETKAAMEEKNRRKVRQFAVEFKSLDSNSDGHLTAKEIRDALMGDTTGKHSSSLKEAMTSFQELMRSDEDGDSVITWHEFLAYMEKVHQNDHLTEEDNVQLRRVPTITCAEFMRKYQTRMARYRKRFETSDQDGDGKLSLPELKAMLIKDNDVPASEWLSTWDQDGNGSISWHEFINAMDSRHTMVVVPPSPKPKKMASLPDLELDELDDGGAREYFNELYPSAPDLSNERVSLSHLVVYFRRVENVPTKRAADELARKVFGALGERDVSATLPYPGVYDLLMKLREEKLEERRKKFYMAKVEKLLSRFEHYDTDGDSVLTREELTRLLMDTSRSESVEQAAAAAAKLMKKTDSDGNQTLSWTEFLAFVEERYAAKTGKSPFHKERKTSDTRT